ncbi:hypothetical protein [Pseudarthrobacter albicanus]|uniref:hypothetical protein n=1 Tax=Pseudarthrobacter albicanus TaxID=2823873 RepID=UPI001BA7E7A3|nr:hypothetical protein [Pseudarthrobacter albicanus]
MTQKSVPAAETHGYRRSWEKANGKSAVSPATNALNVSAAPSRKSQGVPDSPEGTGLRGLAVEDMDLSPLGLKDAPAQEEDEHSLVNSGNS